jgi:hypothetical protein
VQDGQLRLSGEALADIYLGKTTKWNAPALVALNGDRRLPDLAITPVHRAGAAAASYNLALPHFPCCRCGIMRPGGRGRGGVRSPPGRTSSA